MIARPLDRRRPDTRLTALRRDSPALRRGSFVELVSERTSAAYARVLGDERIVVVIGGAAGLASGRVPLAPLGLAAASATVVLGDGVAVRGDGGALVVDLPARGYAILRLAPAPPAAFVVPPELAVLGALLVLASLVLLALVRALAGSRPRRA